MAERVIDIQVALDLEEADAAVEAFQKDFVTRIRDAAAQGQTAFSGLAAKSDTELKKIADASKKAFDDKISKWGKNAKEVRGIVGDLGDAVGSLGKGLLGLSASQQLVADKSIYMAEKGMALGESIGGLFGPIGSLAGSAVGAVGGGLLGYLAGNAEAASVEMIALNNASAAAIKIHQELATKIENLRSQLSNIKTKGLAGDVERFDVVDSEIKASGKKLDLLESEHDLMKRNLNEKIKAGSITEAELAAERVKAQQVKDEQTAYGKLFTMREQIAGRLKVSSDEQTKKDLETFKLKSDMTKQELKDSKKKAENDAQMAENQIAYLNKQAQESDDSTVIGNRTKAILEQSAALAKARSEIESTDGALKSFNKAASSAAKQGVKELKDSVNDLNKELNTLNATVEGSLNRDKVDPLFGLIGFTEDDAKNMTGLVSDLEKDLGGATKSISDSFSDPLNTFDNFVKLGFNNLQSTLFAKTELSLKSAKVVGQAMTDVGNIAKESIAGVATDSFNSWLETIATGEKSADKSFKAIATAAVRNIGSQLVADGVKNILEGSARGIASLGTDPSAGPLIAVGGAEIAAGVGFGAAGARAQRRQGFGDSAKNKGGDKGNLGKAGNANNGTQIQAPSIINLQMLALTDQRQAEHVGKAISQAQRAYAQGRS